MSFHNFASFSLYAPSAAPDLVEVAQEVVAASKRPLSVAAQLRAGIAQSAFTSALVHHLAMPTAPAPERCGEVLLASTDFRTVPDEFLQAPRVRFATVPTGTDDIAEQLNWMWHAGTRSGDLLSTARAREGIEVLIAQVAPEAQFDLPDLAESLSWLAIRAPEITGALLSGDLDDVPELIDGLNIDEVDRALTISTAAWTFVCWSALEQQREACLGWRLIQCPLNQIWEVGGDKPSTIGQIFQFKHHQYKAARELRDLFESRRSITDGRVLRRFAGTFKKFGIEISLADQTALLTEEGMRGIAAMPEALERYANLAEWFDALYRRQAADKDGKNRAGRRADMLNAPISAVHRTAITCARTYHMAQLADRAETVDDLRAMLGAQAPNVLRPCPDRLENRDKFRVRQILHVLRLEFLRDGEHLPKAMKKAAPTEADCLPLELEERQRLRGHEILDECWVQLHKQPKDWRFMAPFGWQCDSTPRIRLAKPAQA